MPSIECGRGMNKRWMRHGVCTPGTQSSESRNIRQVVPGISYGIITGMKEKEHLELPGKAFNLAVLPARTRLFFCTGSPRPLFPPSPCPPTLSSWTVESACSPHLKAVAAELQGESSPPTNQCPHPWKEQGSSDWAEVRADLFIYFKRVKHENSYLNTNELPHFFFKAQGFC